MADHAPPVKQHGSEIGIENDRVAAFLRTLESMASGQMDVRLPISPRHDELDAIAHCINVLVGELSWAGARANEAQKQKAAELQAAVASAEARSGALLRAIPDLMFVLLSDGTIVDYYARDSKLLFVPPEAFLGRVVGEVLPPPVADGLMAALEHARQSDDPIVAEYELPLAEPRFFEARIVRAESDRLLAIIRDVTEGKRASELIHDLARRLISRQEVERQRIARELHDDISQRLAVLNIEIEAIAGHVDSEQLRARLRRARDLASDVATDVHHMSYELHPARLRTLGLIASLQSLCRDTSQPHNLHVTFTHGTIPPSMNEDVSLCLYRIVQEALHNVARHSQAREAQVIVTCSEGQIDLLVIDSGVGFDPRHVPHAGLGLVSMRERVAILKGQLTIDAVPGGGTRVAVRIPVDSGTLQSQLSNPSPFGTSAV
jgi:signal transduction histidine kinase